MRKLLLGLLSLILIASFAVSCIQSQPTVDQSKLDSIAAADSVDSTLVVHIDSTYTVPVK